MTDTPSNLFLNRLGSAKDVATVDTLFDEIDTLAPADKKKVLDDVEAYTVDDFQKGLKPAELSQLQMVIEILDQAKDTPQGKLILSQLEAQGFGEEGRVLAQVILRLHQAKGDDAHTVVKTYVSEAAKLTDEEFGTTFGLLKLMVNVDEKLKAESKPAVRGNPFRKKDGPGGLNP